MEDGSIIIVESGTNLTNRNSEKKYDLTKWFKQQNAIQINSVDLTWVDRMNKKPAVLLKNTNFLVSTYEDEIILEGNVSLAQKENLAGLYFKADLFGDITTSGWSGTITVDGTNINPALIVNQLDLFNFKPSGNLGQGKIESRFSDAKLKQLNADFIFENFEIIKPESSYTINDVAMKMDLLKREDDWLARTNIQYLSDIIGQQNTSSEINIESIINHENKVSSVHLDSNRLDVDVLASILQQYTSIDDFLQKLKINAASINELQLSYINANKTTEQNTLNLKANEIYISAPAVYQEDKTLKKCKYIYLLATTGTKFYQIRISKY